MSYLLSPEHAEHVLCEKDAYTSLTTSAQCIRLWTLYDRRYEYDAHLEFVSVAADLFQTRFSFGDLIKSVQIDGPVTSASLFVQETNFILSESRGPVLPIAVGGIPVIYKSFVLQVKSSSQPPDAIVTFVLLPQHERVKVVHGRHNIATFHQVVDDGPFENKIIQMHDQRTCVVM